MSDQPLPPRWLLRPAHQMVVAGIVMLALVAIGTWWIANGGWQGRLVEIDSAEPLKARFEVDVNKADWPELMQLPGVGTALAHRIVESRQTKGPFASHDDLRRVRGIGPKILEQIRPYLAPVAAESVER